MKIFQSGKPTDRINKLLVNGELKRLKEENNKYVVGIDWGAAHKDYTVLNYGFIHEDGSMEIIGTKTFDQFEHNTPKI